ncbi:hypothetical protein Tco_1085060, partial [Tanacetum coccineum]
MGGSSSQPQSSQPRSPINAFPIEELYTPEFSESLQENTGYWQQPGPYEATTHTSPTKKKKATAKRGRFEPMMYPGRLRGQLRKKLRWLKVGNPFLKTASVSGDASINMNNTIADDDEVHEIRRPGGRDKARAAAKNKGSKASGSSTMNDDALARLVVNEMTTVEVEQCEAFIELKRREVQCREREIAATEYQAQQEDMKLYLQPYDHFTGEQRLAWD